MEWIENTQTTYETKNTDSPKFIQHTTEDEGERVGVEQGPSGGVLQNEQQVNLPTANLDSNSSQKEAFQQKYQPVKVLNSEGEWVSGYWVHKCIVVGNLEEIVRKWALVDELGGKYVFLGQIRLPRVKK